MALFLNEQEVVQLLPMNECIEALGRGIRPRRRRRHRNQAPLQDPYARRLFPLYGRCRLPAQSVRVQGLSLSSAALPGPR